MSEQAKVESIDAIKLFRRALFKFAEMANVAIGDAESEAERVPTWLETEQTTYWQDQLRSALIWFSRCKEAVRMKKLFKDSSGRTPSAIDEEKALRAAQQKLQEAEEKVIAVKRYTQKLQKELLLYKGHIQRFATTVQSGVPMAAAKLDAMISKLEEYVALAAPDAAIDISSGQISSAESMGIPATESLESFARPEPEHPPDQPPPPADSNAPGD